MEGLNIDVGHLRHIRWTTDDNPESAINNEPELTHSGRTAAHNRWIAYNKMRGSRAKRPSVPSKPSPLPKVKGRRFTPSIRTMQPRLCPSSP